MYVGHVGIALGLRRARVAPPLWLLVVAAQLPDWGDSLLELYGARPADPAWGPHGFPLVGLGALGVGLIGVRLARSWRGGAIAALACASHWCADYVTGWKPTWPGGPQHVGLGWYGHAARDYACEAAITFVGWLLWRASLPARDADTRGADTRGADTSARSHAWRTAGLTWALLVGLLLMQLGVDVVMARATVMGG